MAFTFTWPHPAEEVFVTGTFDNWSKSIKLDKSGDVFKKTVTLPKTDEKILYKFVADGEWKHDHTGKTETDHEGNINNILYPTDIMETSAGAAMLSSVAPGATCSTTAMAGEQPLEEKVSAPGAFPETPANEQQTFSVNPLPAADGAVNPIQLGPGEKVPDPSTFTNNTVTSGVHDDPELKGKSEAEQVVSVAPLPAMGASNPVHLAPGEKVPDPSTITGNTLTSNVKLDENSYEKSDASAPVLPPVSNSQGDEAAGTAAVLAGLGPQTSNMIPESSMGMGKDTPAPINPLISSVGPQSTTNELAAQQPIQHHQPPPIVTESQIKAGADPEASASPRAVQEKDEVESELHSKVKEADPASESPSDGKKDGLVAAASGAVAGLGAAAASAAIAAREKINSSTGKDPVSALPESAQNKINKEQEAAKQPNGEAQMSPQTADDNARKTTETVPEEVVASQKEANFDPEASAVPEEVKEKERVEEELLKKVPEREPAPTITSATTATAPVAAAEKSESGAPQLANPVSGVSPLTMDEKSADVSKDLNAPTAEKTNSLATAMAQRPQDSRDVSPMSKPVGGSSNAEPTVTTGVDSSKTPAESKPTTAGAPVGTPRKGNDAAATPQKRHSIIEKLKGTPDSAKTGGSGEGSGKKKGFFSKLKEKLK
ncbi:carbohydrate-binding module family 48 protein [Acidomyces richmondensis BFW]|nr:carbohydrate-binding module family 48 protein [Acidomyces richmondensis BFW]